MKRRLKYCMLVLLCAIFLLPIILTIVSSIKSNQELEMTLAPILKDEKGYASLTFLPVYPTLIHYIRLLFFTPAFYVTFYNSIKFVIWILLGQFVIAVPSAWAFSHFQFRGKNALFFLYVMLMIFPFQVTMLSQYLVLHALNLLNTHLAIILPGIFSTFPVFLCFRGFEQIPEEMFEAARMDGASELKQFFYIGIPLGKNGILSCMILNFLEYWNLCEQPLAFLKDKALWPLSIYLPEIGMENAGLAFSAATIVMIPSAFVFISGQQYLEAGIVASAVKE